MAAKDFLKLGDQVLIRLAEPQDAVRLSEICLLTGDSGSDASNMYQHKEMLGDIYLHPYLEFESDLAFVLVKGEEVVGYAVGALDTYMFADLMNSRWFPMLRDKYAPLATSFNEHEAELWELIQAPFSVDPQILERYPSHLHIDLVASAQGQGFGRFMMSVLLQTLHGAGSQGVHLGISRVNEGASVFYKKIGFQELPAAGTHLIYGRDITKINKNVIVFPGFT